MPIFILYRNFYFDPELPCALIIHSAKRTINYLLFGLSYVYSFSGRKMCTVMTAYTVLMWVPRFKNAYFHTIPSLFDLIQNNYCVL